MRVCHIYGILPLFYGDWHRTRSSGYWIGLYKTAGSRHAPTQWYDGNPSGFRRWTGNEPNSRHTCIRVVRSGFRDENCNHRHFYICKKPIGNCYTATFKSKARFPLPELTIRVNGPSSRLVETRARQNGPCWRVMETGHPSTRAVNLGRQLG